MPDDERLVGTAFSCARRLVKRHMGELTKKDDDHKAKARRVFAERIVCRIRRKARKLRALARTFRSQAKAEFMPMLNFMVELGVLSRDDQKVYQLGDVELAEVIDELLSKLEVAATDGEVASH